MALLAMAVFDTPENGRHGCTTRTIKSILERVHLGRHRLIIINNGSTCPDTNNYLRLLAQALDKSRPENAGCHDIEVINSAENLGTARAINKAWKRRKPGEHCGKLDNDFVIHQDGWVDLLEEVFLREPRVGIACAKRPDLEERPDHENEWYRSRLCMLPHKPGQRWIVVEQVNHCMGTAQLYNSALLDKIGYLYQMQDMGLVYAFDDSLAAVRCRLAGFESVFVPSIPIDHIDPGGTPYTEEKKKIAGEWMARYEQVCREYMNGTRSVYWEDKD